MTKTNKDNLINKLTSFYFEQNNIFYLNVNQEKKEYIQVVKLIDFKNIISYPKTHQNIILNEILGFFNNLNNFSFVKLYEPTNNNFDIKKINKTIELIDEKSVGNKKIYNYLLFQKYNLLNLIKNNLEDDINENTIYENNIYVYFYNENINSLNEAKEAMVSLFDKYDCKYKMLSNLEMLDFFKNIINKDEVNSSYLDVDSRISTSKVFNIKNIEENKKYIKVNDTLFKITHLNLKKDNNVFLKQHLQCFFWQNDFDWVLNVYKDKKNNQSRISFILINESNTEKDFFENESKITNLLKNENVKADNKLTTQIENIFPFINQEINSYSFNLEDLIKSNPFKAYKICNNNFFVGMNNMHQLVSLNEKQNIINLGNDFKLLHKWVDFHLISNSNLILLDFHNDFSVYNNMNSINDFRINLLDLNRNNLDSIQEIKLNKISFLIKLFKMINSSINQTEILALKEILNKLYDDFIKKIKTSSLEVKAPTLEELIKSINKFSKKEKINLNTLIDIIRKLTSNSKVNNLINGETNINLTEQNFWIFNLSFINDLSSTYQNIIKSIFLNYLLENIQENSFIYLGSLNKFLENEILTKQVNNLLNSNKIFIYTKYVDLKEIKMLENKIKPILNKFDYVIINPNIEFNEKYWDNIMNLFDLIWSDNDYKKLNTLDKSNYVIIDKYKKYWCKERGCYNDELKKQQQINEIVLVNKIFEIERYIYYKNKELKEKQNKFLLNVLTDTDTQKKIREENLKYIKRLL